MAPKATASVIIVYIDYLLKILLDFNWPFFFSRMKLALILSEKK